MIYELIYEVYEVDVEGEKSPVMTYYGQTQREFKKRWLEHKHAMSNEREAAEPRVIAIPTPITCLRSKCSDMNE